MAAFLVAGKAILEAGIPLKGDLIVSAVAGEISREPIDEWQGPALSEQGPRGAVHGDPRGRRRLRARRRGDGLRDRRDRARARPISRSRSSPTRRATTRRTCPARPAWPTRRTRSSGPPPSSRPSRRGPTHYQVANTYESPNGTIVPKASINAIRAGYPFGLTSAPQLCSFYVDTRILPGANPLDLRDAAQDDPARRRGRRDGRAVPLPPGLRGDRRGASDRDGPALPRPGVRHARR